ncbi:cysteine alpha-hairpin motif superfamily, partial [Phyllosticta citricarpa]
AATTHSKSLSEYYDPCQEAASRSIRCLHRNGGDRDLCSDYFQAYRDCKKQWVRDLPSTTVTIARIVPRIAHLG